MNNNEALALLRAAGATVLEKVLTSGKPVGLEIASMSGEAAAAEGFPERAVHRARIVCGTCRGTRQHHTMLMDGVAAVGYGATQINALKALECVVVGWADDPTTRLDDGDGAARPTDDAEELAAQMEAGGFTEGAALIRALSRLLKD